ncbi:hypothetical protein C8J56DRAFT_918858 [Mycena floridula]|nr:hypothetical protein C8J56DRAFT_918858 [Mycena floridula]
MVHRRNQEQELPQSIRDNESDEQDSEMELEDPDMPRVAQWIDEDDLEDESDEEEEVAEASDLKTLQNDLSTLPMGVLRKAQAAIESESDSESSTSEPQPIPSRKGKEKEWSLYPKNDIPKRSNKHAPTEVTSKRPVTRRREIVNVHTPQVRDPRFLPLSGQFDPDKYRANYGFLSEAHQTELTTLQDNLKRARRLLASAPRATRQEQEEEVQRLELAVNRARSAVNRDRQQKVEQEALSKVSKAEKEKQKQGKAGWWMKDAEKKQLLTRARYEGLAEEGGQRAVKKAIMKKQKKTAQKEKKSRPFRAGASKQPSERQETRPHKRRKLA